MPRRLRSTMAPPWCASAGEGHWPISRRATASPISASRPTTANFLHVEIRDQAGNTTKHVMPADSDDMTTVLDQELASWGRHSVYLKALAAAEPLL